MKKQLILLVCILLSNMLFSQAVPTALEAWRTTDGTQNFYYKPVTKTDPSGNVIVAGTTNAGSTTDILVAKYNAAGNQLWIQQFQGAATGGVDFAAGLTVDNNYIYITGGVTNNSVTAETDCVTMKLASSTGSVVWSASYDGAGNFHDAGRHIVVDGSGNVYVSGGSYNASMNTDFLCLKYNSSGVQQWVSTWDYLGFDDAATKGATSGSNLNLTGAVTTATPNVYKVATLSLSQSTGSLLATSVGTAVTTTSVDVVTDFTSDGSGNIIVVGSNNVIGEGNNFYVQKLSNTLVSTWTYTWNGSSSLNDVAKAVELDASGNVYIAGFSTSSTLGREVILIKLNSSGVHQWTQTSGFAGDDEAIDLVLSASGVPYLAGYRTLNGNKNYYTAKYDVSGTKVWEIEMDGNYGKNDYATNMALDSLGNIIVTGQTETTPSFYNFTTVKYTEHDVITPTDFNGEVPVKNFMYYPNQGQLIDTTHSAVPDIKFYTNNTYPAFYFKNNSQSFVFSKSDTASTGRNDTLHRIDLNFTNSIENAKVYPMERQDNGYLNYFLAHTDSNGIVGIHGNQRLIIPNLYSNIDLMYSSNQNGIKYYYIVKPGGDMRDIKLEFTGATSYSLNGTTNVLSINSSIGSLTFDKPVAYQLTAGNATIAVTSFSPTWTTDGAANKYKFNDGAYTNSLTLVIEVDQGNNLNSSNGALQNITWSTYLGKSSEEAINKVKTDNSDNLFAVGKTFSSVFPVGVNGSVYHSFNAGSIDGFVSKFNPIGELLWSTFVGGTNKDNLVDLAFHSNGDLYCVGTTNSNDLNPKNKSGADNDGTFAGPNPVIYNKICGDGYIFQLAQDGLTNSWLRYYGGDDLDIITGCAMDHSNTFFILGYSSSDDITVTYSGSSHHQNNTFNGTSGPGMCYDGIIARFNSNSVITWATYIGSSTQGVVGQNPNDYLMDIVIKDGFDGGPPDLYIAGESYGDNYPNVSTTISSINSSNYSLNTDYGSDAVITRFTNSGEIVWSTYFGGSNYDIANSMTYGNNFLYLTGRTNSSDFLPINSGSDYYQSHGGNDDAIFLKVDNNNVITHSSCLGGSDFDEGWDIDYDPVNGTAYISGGTQGSHFPFPMSNPANTYSQTYKGLNDNFICALKDNRTSILWTTYLGGSSNEYTDNAADDPSHQAICIDGNNHLYLGGFTRTSQSQTNPFPLDNGGGAPTYFQPLIDGASDATITKFDLVPVNIVGIREYASLNDGLLIYPNPASSKLFLKLNTKVDKATYKVLNALGQIVLSGSLYPELNSINVENLKTGFYIIELINANSKISAKFIKHE